MDIPARRNLFEVMNGQPTVVQRLEHGSQRLRAPICQNEAVASTANPSESGVYSNEFQCR
jgi:hypothetical protein